MGKNSQYQNAMELYNQYKNMYTGEEGYNKSLALGQKGAAQVAQGQQAASTTAARNAGLNRSAAAMLGSQQNAAAYGNAMQNQQGMASQMLGNRLNTQGNIVSSAQAEGQNEYDRAWGNVGNALGIAGAGVQIAGEMFPGMGKLGQAVKNVMSDERLKNIKGEGKTMKQVSDERLKYYYDITDEWVSNNSDRVLSDETKKKLMSVSQFNNISDIMDKHMPDRPRDPD